MHPPDGDKRQYAVWKQVKVFRGYIVTTQTPDYQLRDLLIWLSKTWLSFFTFNIDPAIPWTNNGTNQGLDA